jgi:hypothetical protein
MYKAVYMSASPSVAMDQAQGTELGVASLRIDRQHSEELGNTPDTDVPRPPDTDVPKPQIGNTAMDVVLDFKVLDQNKDGEITAAEFIDGLRSNRQLASKFGLSEDFIDDGTRTKYELIFGCIDYNQSETVNVTQFPA